MVGIPLCTRRAVRSLALACALLAIGFVLGRWSKTTTIGAATTAAVPPYALLRIDGHKTTPVLYSASPIGQLCPAIAAAFRPRMNSTEKAAALLCLGVLDETLSGANVTYFLYGGTMLGARRHRGIIPWDDDIDVLANYTQLNDLEAALLSVDGYELHAWHDNRYKFYPRDGAPISGETFRWPYVDVCFFSENATHVYDNFPGLSDTFVYAKEDLFPLVRRPFDGLVLPTPANEERAIALNYDERTCESNWFSHRDEAEVDRSEVMSVPCAALYSMYPFIFRNGTTVKETLKVGDQIIGEFIMS